MIGLDWNKVEGYLVSIGAKSLGRWLVASTQCAGVCLCVCTQVWCVCVQVWCVRVRVQVCVRVCMYVFSRPLN